MDPIYDRNMIDIEYTTDISQKMQVPNRLSLIIPSNLSSESVGGMEVPGRVLVSGSRKSTDIYDPYDIHISKPSLDAPPQSLVLSQIDYPDIDRIRKPEYSTVNGSRETSNLSLFHGSIHGQGDDELTLVDHNMLDTYHPTDSLGPADTLESQMQELVARVSVLEEAIAIQHRREMLAFILLGTYFLLKLGRCLL